MYPSFVRSFCLFAVFSFLSPQWDMDRFLLSSDLGVSFEVNAQLSLGSTVRSFLNWGVPRAHGNLKFHDLFEDLTSMAPQGAGPSSSYYVCSPEESDPPIKNRLPRRSTGALVRGEAKVEQAIVQLWEVDGTSSVIHFAALAKNFEPADIPEARSMRWIRYSPDVDFLESIIEDGWDYAPEVPRPRSGNVVSYIGEGGSVPEPGASPSHNLWVQKITRHWLEGDRWYPGMGSSLSPQERILQPPFPKGKESIILFQPAAAPSDTLEQLDKLKLVEDSSYWFDNTFGYFGHFFYPAKIDSDAPSFTGEIFLRANDLSVGMNPLFEDWHSQEVATKLRCEKIQDEEGEREAERFLQSQAEPEGQVSFDPAQKMWALNSLAENTLSPESLQILVKQALIVSRYSSQLSVNEGLTGAVIASAAALSIKRLAFVLTRGSLGQALSLVPVGGLQGDVGDSFEIEIPSHGEISVARLRSIAEAIASQDPGAIESLNIEQEELGYLMVAGGAVTAALKRHEQQKSHREMSQPPPSEI